MNRRHFLQRSLASAALGLANLRAPGAALGAAPPVTPYRNLLVLIELKGGNDGLNTLVPFEDPTYYALRPKIAITRDSVVQLSAHAGLHPALAPLMPLWESRELAILQGVGYPEPNLSHFRSIEIWDTASASATARVPEPASGPRSFDPTITPSAANALGGGAATNVRVSQPSCRYVSLADAVSQISIERKCDRLGSG